MKTSRNLIIAGCLCASPGVHAVAISDMSIDIDWGSLVITGPLGSPVSFYDPLNNQTLSEGADGWVGADGTELDYASAIEGASALATYGTPSMSLTGGYDANDNISGGVSVITNTAPGVLSGWAGGYRGFIYQASGTGQVTVSVNYSLVGNVSTTSLSEYANGGYSLFMDASDADIWSSTYAAEIAGGSTIDAAEQAASLASRLATYEFSNWQVIESYGCWNAPVCSTFLNDSNALSLTFDVVAGTRYHFGVDATVGGYTQVSAVPVPAAVWLLGSGLAALVGVSGRRRG